MEMCYRCHAEVPAENAALHKLRCRRGPFQPKPAVVESSARSPRSAPSTQAPSARSPRAPLQPSRGPNLSRCSANAQPSNFAYAPTPRRREASRTSVWSCSECTYLNSTQSSVCGACDSARSTSSSSGQASQPSNAGDSATGVVLKYWRCPHCTCSNKAGRSLCAVCGERFSKERVRELLTSPRRAVVAEPVDTAEPTKEVTGTLQTADSDIMECPICFEEFQHAEDRLFLPCCHSFHAACVDGWLVTRGTCPTCRHPANGSGINMDTFLATY